jgi:hypothetical protein
MIQLAANLFASIQRYVIAVDDKHLFNEIKH